MKLKREIATLMKACIKLKGGRGGRQQKKDRAVLLSK